MIALTVSAAVLTACGGPSDEKVAEVRSAAESLSAKRAETEALYGELTNDAEAMTISNYASYADSLNQVDLADLTDEEIDAQVLPDFAGLYASYDALHESLTQEKKAEKEAEAALGLKEIALFLTNDTGDTITSIHLEESADTAANVASSAETTRNASGSSTPVSLLPEGQALSAMESLAIAGVQISQDATEMQLRLTTSGGEELLVPVDLSATTDNGLQISLKAAEDAE